MQCFSNFIEYLSGKKTLAHWKKSYQGMGVPIEEIKFLFCHNYAEDQVVIDQDADDLEFNLKRLKTAYKEWGLTISFNI